MNNNFEYITNLQYRTKALSTRVKAFESGEKYIVMCSKFKSQLLLKDKEIKRLKSELANAHSQTVTTRNNWILVTEDLESEYKKQLGKKDTEIKNLKERLWKTQEKHDITKEKLKEKTIELYKVMVELEEEKGKNQKLIAQINRDYENSSIPSSMKSNRKKIANNREKTGRKPGGQPGHKGHCRKKHNPTNRIKIPAPPKYANSPDYKLTGKTITKQVVNIKVQLLIDEYETPEYRSIYTHQRVHADFPPGVINEVSYGGSVKAFAFLLNNRCCVSIDKIREFLSDLTDGELQISKGMINGLCKEFSKKTIDEQRKTFSDILVSPIVNTDFTSVRLNGKNAQVAICATPDKAMYFAREHKGHKGIKGTPVENYQGILVHDHDKTFYNYGGEHQECLAHVLRYLKDSIENEPDLQWNTKMRELLQEMIHYRNKFSPNESLCPDKTKAYINKYQEILELAKTEYEYVPPSNYYRDGYNLYKRLLEYEKNHLLFLKDQKIPTSNNLSERLLRILKRKQKQSTGFRSSENLSYLCDCLGIIASLCNQNPNLYRSISSIFE